jgi:hypothetical protein
MMTAADVFWTNQTFTSMGRDTGKTLSRSRWRFHYQRRRHRGIGTVVVDCLAAICRRADCADSDSRCHNGSTGTWRVLHVDYMTPTAKQQLMTCVYVVRFLPYCSDWLMEQKQNMLVHTSIDMTHAAVESNYDEQLSNNTQTHVTLRIHKLWPCQESETKKNNRWLAMMAGLFFFLFVETTTKSPNWTIPSADIDWDTHTFFWSFTDLIKCW